jgi:hypothetical protein
MPYTAKEGALASFLDGNAVSLILLSGDASGMEYHVDQQRVIFGRGPGVDLAVEASGLAREHATIEFWGDAYVVREVDTEYPILLNGGPVRCCELKHGDRIELGELAIEFVCRKRQN